MPAYGQRSYIGNKCDVAETFLTVSKINCWNIERNLWKYPIWRIILVALQNTCLQLYLNTALPNKYISQHINMALPVVAKYLSRVKIKNSRTTLKGHFLVSSLWAWTNIYLMGRRSTYHKINKPVAWHTAFIKMFSPIPNSTPSYAGANYNKNFTVYSWKCQI